MANKIDDLVSHSYRIISDMIFSYQLPPSSLVSDFSLSRKIGISRTPVRQAILKLQAEGLIEHNDNGFYVISLTEDVIHELYDARRCLESSVVPLLIEKKVDLSILRSICEKEQEALNKGMYIEALNLDIKFHNMLVALVGNSLLSYSCKMMCQRMKLINLLSLASINVKSPDMYLEIIEAIEKGDIEESRTLIDKQLNLGEAQKITSLRKFGNLNSGNLFSFISNYFYLSNSKKIIEEEDIR